MITIEEELKRGERVISFTKGVSMEPLLHEGRSHVLLVPAMKDVPIGEIGLFKRAEGIYVLHRIIRKDDANYYTRGDNCFTVEIVPRQEMLGIVETIYKGNKAISVRDPVYQGYVRFWNATAGIRIICLKIKAKIKCMGRK